MSPFPLHTSKGPGLDHGSPYAEPALPSPSAGAPRLGKHCSPAWASGLMSLPSLLFSLLASPEFPWRDTDCSLNPIFPPKQSKSLSSADAAEPDTRLHCLAKRTCPATDLIPGGSENALPSPVLARVQPSQRRRPERHPRTQSVKWTVPPLPLCALLPSRTTHGTPATHFFLPQAFNQRFPGSSVVKNPTANAGDAGDVGLIPG